MNFIRLKRISLEEEEGRVCFLLQWLQLWKTAWTRRKRNILEPKNVEKWKQTWSSVDTNSLFFLTLSSCLNFSSFSVHVRFPLSSVGVFCQEKQQHINKNDTYGFCIFLWLNKTIINELWCVWNILKGLLLGKSCVDFFLWCDPETCWSR